MSALNQTQLITRVRRSAFLANTDVNFTDLVILEDLNDVQTQLYARAVIEADQGVWQMTDYTALVANQRSYRLPARAVMGTTMRSQVSSTGNVDWWPVEDLSEADALRYEYGALGNAYGGAPTRKITRGENWWLLPPVTASNAYVMRTHYMVRPSRICGPQSDPNAGVISAINTATRTLTLVATVASINEAGISTSLFSTTTAIDILRPGGWFKVQWNGQGTFNGAGTSVVLAADSSGINEANDLSDIAVGDVVRAPDQTDWPALPADYHRSLADATAAKILTARGMADRAAELSQAYVVPDLERFGDLLRPRDSSSAFVFVAPEFA